MTTGWMLEQPCEGVFTMPVDEHPNAAGWQARRTAILTAPPSVDEDEETLRSTIGKRIKDERQHYKITQRDLAAAAGVSHAFLSAIERGAQTLDAYRLRRLADALGQTMDDLFGVTGRKVWGLSRDPDWYDTAIAEDDRARFAADPLAWPGTDPGSPHRPTAAGARTAVRRATASGHTDIADTTEDTRGSR